MAPKINPRDFCCVTNFLAGGGGHVAENASGIDNILQISFAGLCGDLMLFAPVRAGAQATTSCHWRSLLGMLLRTRQALTIYCRYPLPVSVVTVCCLLQCEQVARIN